MALHTWLAVSLYTILLTGASCLKNVRMEMIPDFVEQGHDATMRCYYDLQGQKLYSLKWYRGNTEFYRYSPNEQPPIKIFNTTWLKIDPNNSNENQVTITKVDFPLNGNFSCEVTADTPTFSTEIRTKTLTVVSIPKDKPLIESERPRYEVGDTLKANCSTPYSVPPAKFSFTLNNAQLETKQPSQRKYYGSGRGIGLANSLEEPEHQLAEVSLELKPFHFENGQLSLRCTAKILDVYEKSSEVQLGNVQREPVPERVRSENAGQVCHRIADLTIVVLVLLALHLR